MDCDFTHSPSYIPEVLRGGADVVVGSRYMNRKSLAGWNWIRKLLTLTGHLLTKGLLGMDYDATGGFRLYRLDRIPRSLFEAVRSKGYSFFFESLYLLHLNGISISQISIILPPRTYGHSKMTGVEVFRSVRLLCSLFLSSRLHPARFPPKPLAPGKYGNIPGSRQAWDVYWSPAKSTGQSLYNWIAALYRRWVTRKALKFFVKKYYRPGSSILHAGCGTGQVDGDLEQTVSITALDISEKTLLLYRSGNRTSGILNADLLRIPLSNASMDGIYNLGVMEHFTEGEIRQILLEFSRVLRAGGRLLVFWPPEFGLSVMFFKMLAFIKRIARSQKALALYPPEITRLRSRSHARRIFESAGFRIVAFHFGVRDLFTHAVIVADKDGTNLSP